MPADAPPPAGAAMELGGAGAYRTRLQGGGRAHVDRPLPFLILHRMSEQDPDSLARRVAVTGSAYVVWTGGEDRDRDAAAVVGAIARKQRETYSRVLLVSLYDLPRDEDLADDAPRLADFTARIGASADPAAQAAADCLELALAGLEVDLRHCSVARAATPFFEPGIAALADGEPAISHLSLGLPQNYRMAGGTGLYPQLFHDLAIGVFDALLQGFRAFVAEISPGPVPHHRAFGRSSFIAAARTVDRKLDRICGAFDFLLSVSPINSQQSFERFKASKHQQAPVFRYRPLTVDPEVAKRQIYATDLRRVEDPVLEALFAEKRRELDQQLTMLQCRNTPSFRYASLMLYAPVESALLESAREILDTVDWGAAPATDRDMIGASEIREAAHHVVARYRDVDPDFAARISLREDIAAGLMVSGRRLLIATATRMRRDRLDALLQHEISVHLLTYFNGSAQGLKIFRTGLAGYEGIQEGLGVFAEYAVGGLTRSRLRLLAARVLIVDAMIDGADFVQGFRLLHDGHGFGARTAFNIVARVYRSGGLSKDAIYLRGFTKVLAILASGRDLTPFWFGKIAAEHIPVVEELELRGLLHRPRFIPEFLARPQAQARIATLRANPALSTLF